MHNIFKCSSNIQNPTVSKPTIEIVSIEEYNLTPLLPMKLYMNQNTHQNHKTKVYFSLSDIVVMFG